MLTDPSEPGASADDIAGNSAVMASLSTSPDTVQGLINDVTSKGSKHCSWQPTTTLEYPCGGWKFSPMWQGLMRADEMLYPGRRRQLQSQTCSDDSSCEYLNDGDCDDGGPGSDYSECEYGTDCSDCGPRVSSPSPPPPASGPYAAQRKVIIVVSDGLPLRTNPGTKFNRAAYLTLNAATTVKDKGATIIGVGVGSSFTSAIGGSVCEPWSCHSHDGGAQLFHGTAVDGTVNFACVDTSEVSCNGNKGCGGCESVTLNALVSGSHAADREANSHVLASTDDLLSVTQALFVDVCFPHETTRVDSGYSCGSWQAKNLGTTYTTPEECGAAAVMESGCPSPKIIMFSAEYNYAWGCRCCFSGYERTANAYWDTYVVNEPHTPPLAPPPPPTPLAYCFTAQATGAIPQGVLYPDYGLYTTDAKLAQEQCRLRLPYCVGVVEEWTQGGSRWYVSSCGEGGGAQEADEPLTPSNCYVRAEGG